MMEIDLNRSKASLRTNLVQEQTTICHGTHDIGVPGGYKDTIGSEMRRITSFLYYLYGGVSIFRLYNPKHNNKRLFCHEVLS